jgi:hypothetical protein
MKHNKEHREVPSDYEVLLHLPDIQNWKKLPRTIAETEIKSYGFHSCVYEDIKVVVVK